MVDRYNGIEKDPEGAYVLYDTHKEREKVWAAIADRHKAENATRCDKHKGVATGYCHVCTWEYEHKENERLSAENSDLRALCKIDGGWEYIGEMQWRIFKHPASTRQCEHRGNNLLNPETMKLKCGKCGEEYDPA